MELNPNFRAKLIPNRMDVRWNSLEAQLICIWTQRPQIERTYETLLGKYLRNMPELDDEYWLMVEEHIAILALYLNANLLFTVEDRPTLAPTLVAVLFLKKSLAQSSPLTLYHMIGQIQILCGSGSIMSFIA